MLINKFTLYANTFFCVVSSGDVLICYIICHIIYMLFCIVAFLVGGDIAVNGESQAISFF